MQCTQSEQHNALSLNKTAANKHRIALANKCEAYTTKQMALANAVRCPAETKWGNGIHFLRACMWRPPILLRPVSETLYQKFIQLCRFDCMRERIKAQ